MQEIVVRTFHINSESYVKICQSARYLNLLVLRNDVAAWLFLTGYGYFRKSVLSIVIIFVVIFPFPPSNVSFLAACNKGCCFVTYVQYTQTDTIRQFLWSIGTNGTIDSNRK